MKSVEEALSSILGATPRCEPEAVDLLEARGRVLAAPLVSDRTLPPWDNSEMDGYAVRASDVREPPVSLEVQGEVPAGALVETPLLPGHAYRIFTGAPLPQGADAVVKQEDTAKEGRRVRIDVAVPAGRYVRGRGSDVSPGAVLLSPGVVIGAGEIGLAAALGRTELAVFRRPVVAILSTGDELVEPDCTPGPSQIVNSNGFAIAALVEEVGARAVRLPIAKDDPAIIEERLLAARDADVVLTIGGVSVGERDYVKDVLAKLGCVTSFWRVNIKPGKPLLFGTWDQKLVFALPGNPVSSMITFELFVRPALLRKAGHDAIARPRARGRLRVAIHKDDQRRHYVRARALRGEDGELDVYPNPKQGSGQLTSMIGINALVVVPESSSGLAQGSSCDVLLLRDPA